MRFETGVFEFDLDSINLHEGGEGTTATILEYKKRALTPKDEINETEKIDNNVQFEDCFFQKGGKQNAALNTLPLFEDVYYAFFPIFHLLFDGLFSFEGYVHFSFL